MPLFGPPLSVNSTDAERQLYRRNTLKLPGPVDRWLTSNARMPNASSLADYFMWSDVKAEYVVCIVERICEEVSPCFSRIGAFLINVQNIGNLKQEKTYRLHITANAQSLSDHDFMPRTSPRAVMETFTGSSRAIDAPEWTQWPQPTLRFQHPLVSFAVLFMRMASWDINKNQVRFRAGIYVLLT